MDLANRILERRNFGSQRVNMYWLSGAESEKLVKSVIDAYEKAKRAGPNPIKSMNINTDKEIKELIIPPVE